MFLLIFPNTWLHLELLNEHKEKDAPTLAVNKRFLGVDSVVVDHCQDETSEISKVDKDCKTTVKQADISG